MNKRPGAEATFDNKLGLTIAEAGSIIGVRRSAVYKLIRTGRLPARKIGSRTIVLRDDAIAFLRSLPALPARGARPWPGRKKPGAGGSPAGLPRVSAWPLTPRKMSSRPAMVKHFGEAASSA